MAQQAFFMKFICYAIHFYVEFVCYGMQIIYKDVYSRNVSLFFQLFLKNEKFEKIQIFLQFYNKFI